MGVNAFNKPSPLLNYQPIPFRDIAFMGDKLKKTSDNAFDMGSALSELKVDARTPDIGRRNELVDDIAAKAEEILKIHKSNPNLANQQLRRLGTQAHKSMTRGQLFNIARSKAAEDKFHTDQAKLYDDGTIDEHTYQYNKDRAAEVGGIGEANEQGAYNIFQGRRGVNSYNLNDAANKFITGYKSDKHLGGVKMVQNAATGLVEYYDRATTEEIKGPEVQLALEKSIKSNPDAMNYIYELALTTNKDPNDIFNNLIDAYTNKAAYKKTTGNYKLGKAGSARLADYNNPDEPVTPPYYSTVGTGDIDMTKMMPDFMQGVSFGNDGFVSKPWHKSVTDVLQSPPAYNPLISKEANEEAWEKWEERKAKGSVPTKEVEAKIQDLARQYGIPLSYDSDGWSKSFTPRQLHKTIEEAFKNESANETTSIQLGGSKSMRRNRGDQLAGTMSSAKIYLAHPKTGVVMNPDGSPEVLEKAFGEDWEIKVAKMARDNGQAGWDHNSLPFVAGADKKGEIRRIIFDGNKGKNKIVKAQNDLNAAKRNVTRAVVVDESNKLTYIYDPKLEGGKFVHHLKVLGKPLPGDVDPFNMSSAMDTYYDADNIDFNSFREGVVQRLSNKGLMQTDEVGTKSSTPRGPQVLHRR